MRCVRAIVAKPHDKCVIFSSTLTRVGICCMEWKFRVPKEPQYKKVLPHYSDCEQVNHDE